MPAQQKDAPSRAPAGVVSDKPIALSLPQLKHDALERHAAREKLTVAAFARLMYRRGFAAYQQDRRSLTRGFVEGQMARPHIALRLLPDELQSAHDSAATEGRKRADIARLFVLSGLFEYEAEMA